MQLPYTGACVPCVRKTGSTSINKDATKKAKLKEFFEKSKYDNINELLDKVVFDNKPSAIIIIDEATEEL